MAEEGLQTTANELIHIGKPIPFDSDEFIGQLGELMLASYGNDKEIKKKVSEIVTTYKCC